MDNGTFSNAAKQTLVFFLRFVDGQARNGLVVTIERAIERISFDIIANRRVLSSHCNIIAQFEGHARSIVIAVHISGQTFEVGFVIDEICLQCAIALSGEDIAIEALASSGDIERITGRLSVTANLIASLGDEGNRIGTYGLQILKKHSLVAAIFDGDLIVGILRQGCQAGHQRVAETDGLVVVPHIDILQT